MELCVSGKGGRLYPAYSLSGSEGEDNSPSRYLGSGRVQHTYQQPGALSDTQTSDNASDATLTDSELALARDSTLLVHNGEYIPYFCPNAHHPLFFTRVLSRDERCFPFLKRLHF